MIARVNAIFRRRSGVRKTRAMALNKGISSSGMDGASQGTVYQSTATGAGGCPPAPVTRLLDRTACGDDLLLGRTRDLVDRHVQRDRDVAAAEDLDRAPRTYRPSGHQVRDVNLTRKLADAEIGRRRFTSDMLVNLARRNQSMLYRQLEIINQLEQLPVQGSVNHLKEVRQELGGVWQALVPSAQTLFVAGEGQAAFAQLRERWGVVDETLAKLEGGYVRKDNAALTAVLEEDWPVMHKAAVKPLQSLIPLTQAAAGEAYAEAKVQSERMLQGGLLGGVACLLVLVATAAWTIRSLLSPLAGVESAMRHIAEGDLSTPLPAPRQDELGRMLEALSAMQRQLRELVGQVRTSTDSISTASTEIATGTLDLSNRTNPRMPLVSEIVDLLKAGYYGTEQHAH